MRSAFFKLTRPYDVAIKTIHEAGSCSSTTTPDSPFAPVSTTRGTRTLDDFFNSGPALALFDVIFEHVEGYEGCPHLKQRTSSSLGAQETAAAYARNYGGTVKEIRKAQRVNEAFQQVLDDPGAAEALQHSPGDVRIEEAIRIAVEAPEEQGS